MVCLRCKIVVKMELEKLGVDYGEVDLGEVEIPGLISPEQRDKIRQSLLKSGLELLDDKKSVLIQQIKSIIIDLVHNSTEPLAIKLSEYLSRKLNHDYTYLANVFSGVQGATIEKFYISHKIERVKEFLIYKELTLTEIAYMMHYSSVAHLSSQFRKVTGLTPSDFKQQRHKRTSLLEDV
jgi:AraC-like DNA-binding protein